MATTKVLIMKRAASTLGAALVVAIAGCGGQNVANPFTSGITGGKVVANELICDPTPTTCGRYVVIDPLPGTTQAALVRSAEAVLQRRLGWRRSAGAPVPATQGVSFDGPTARQGAYVNTAAAELRLDTADLDTGASASAGGRLLAAMRLHPTAVVVRIIHT